MIPLTRSCVGGRLSAVASRSSTTANEGGRRLISGADSGGVALIVGLTGVSLPFSAAVAVLPPLGSGAGLDLPDGDFWIASSFCSLASVLAPALSPPLAGATGALGGGAWGAKHL